MGVFSRSHITCIYFMSFLDLFSVSILIPLLGPYLKSLGASHLIISLSGSLYGVAQLCSSPLVGSWSDSHGRLSVLTYSLAVCSLCYLAMGLTHSFHVILLLRFLTGCSKHSQSLYKAIIADEVPHSEQANVYGTLAAVSGIGFVLGPTIGGHLADTDDFIYISITIMGCIWFNIALARTLPHHHHKKRDPPSDSNLLSNFLQIFTHLQNINWKRHKTALTLKLLIVCITGIYYNNYSITLKEKYGLPTKTVGYIISFQALVGSLSAISSSKIRMFNRNRRAIITVCFLMITMALVGLEHTSTVLVLLFWLIPYAMGTALLRTLLTELLVQNAAVEERGSLLGAAQSLSSFGRLSAPILAGITTDAANGSALSLISQLSAAMGAVLSMILV